VAIDPEAPMIQTVPPKNPDNLRGLLIMALAFFMFAASDAQVKLLSSTLHPVQIAWTRQLGLLSAVIVLLMLNGPAILKTARPFLQLLRGSLAVLSATSYVIAISFVPLADAVAVSFVAPFMVTVMGAVFLGEKVGVRRWVAVSIGFAATLIIIRPGLGVVHPAMLLVLVAASTFAARQVLSRVLSASDKTATTIAYTGLASVALLTLPLPFVWRTPDTWAENLLLLGTAACAGIGELMVIRALEIAQAVAVAPVHYSLILWSTFYGWLIFGQLPDQWTLTGAAIIVATGFYILNRERKLTKRG
jgi:drug/metabolite transporter (DMT)-like permease